FGDLFSFRRVWHPAIPTPSLFKKFPLGGALLGGALVSSAPTEQEVAPTIALLVQQRLLHP
ncbi:hypothetical protein, partial [Leyella stercorea]|uniref:hypothetical protein n=1 Tax=Leyella stercorea TaxID=363265 RepID=UPI00266CF2EC